MALVAKHALRERQKQVLIDLIKSAKVTENVPAANGSTGRLHDATAPSEQDLSTWKLLLYDTKGRDIIAPLLKVKELHDLGVTLHLPMTKERHPVPNSPAIYLCEPTEANINIIAKDCLKELYLWVYINFTSPCPRQRLEYLAEQLATSGTLHSIRHIHVYDQSLGFVAEGNDLYSLMIPRSFITLNSRHTPDAVMEEHIESIAQGLSHVLLSQDLLPVVAYGKNGPAELIAGRLSTTLCDLFRERQLSGNHSPMYGRPLVLVVDRSADLAAALHHPFTYRGLLVDALGMHLNKVTADPGKSFDIDPINDSVYQQHGGEEFGEFSKNVQRALEAYQREYAALTKSSGIDESEKDAITEMLANAPKLREKKMALDAHMTLAHAVLSHIKKNQLDKLHGVEEAMLHQEGLQGQEMEELLSSDLPIQDKQRLYLIASLLSEGDEAANETIDRLLHYVSGPERPPFPAWTYYKQLKSWSLGGKAAAQQQQQQGGWGFAQTLAKTLASTFTNTSKEDLPLTRLVDALLQDPPQTNRSSQAATRQKLLSTVGAKDPRTNQAIDLSNVRFSQVIVFVAGGGSVVEFDNLKLWESRHSRKSVVYGSTDMMNGTEMLEQLGILGDEK